MNSTFQTGLDAGLYFETAQRKPECDYAADCHGQKFTYSISVNVMNDDEKHILQHNSRV